MNTSNKLVVIGIENVKQYIEYKIKKTNEIRQAIKEIDEAYQLDNDKFCLLYNSYINYNSTNLGELTHFNNEFWKLLSYYEKLLAKKKADKERELKQKAGGTKRKLARTRKKIDKIERIDIKKLNKELLKHINNISSNKIFSSAEYCKETLQECSNGLRIKSNKNTKYDSDKSEIRKYILDLITCMVMYNRYYCIGLEGLDSRSRDIFSIYLLESMQIEINNCMEYIEKLSKNGYNININTKLIDEYKKNYEEYYRYEWGDDEQW